MSDTQKEKNPVRAFLYAWASRNGIKNVQVEAASRLGVTRGAVGYWLKSGFVSNRSLLQFSELVGCSPYEVSSSARTIHSANL